MNSKRRTKARSDLIFSELPGIQTESDVKMQRIMGGQTGGRQEFSKGLLALQSGDFTRATSDFTRASADFMKSHDNPLYAETVYMLSATAAEEEAAASGSAHPTMQANENMIAAQDLLLAATTENGLHSAAINTLANSQYSLARSEWLTLAQNQQNAENYTGAGRSYSYLQGLDSAFGHQSRASNDAYSSQGEHHMWEAISSVNSFSTMAEECDKAGRDFFMGNDASGARLASYCGAKAWDAAFQTGKIQGDPDLPNHTLAQYLDNAANDWFQLGDLHRQQIDLTKAADYWYKAGENNIAQAWYDPSFLKQASNDFAQANIDYNSAGHTHRASIALGMMDAVKGDQEQNDQHYNSAAQSFEDAAQALISGNAGAGAIANLYEQEADDWASAGHLTKAANTLMKAGSLERISGSLGMADSDFHGAAEDFEQVKNLGQAAWAYTNLADVEYQQAPGSNDGEIAHWEKAEMLYAALAEQAKTQSQSLDFLQDARNVGQDALHKLSSSKDCDTGIEVIQAHLDSLIAAIYEDEKNWSEAANYRMSAGNDYVAAAQIAVDNKNGEEIKVFYAKAADQYGINNKTSSANAFDDFQSAGEYSLAAKAYADAVNAQNNE